MIDVYDDVLEEHNAILIDDEVKKISWKYDYSSEPSKPNKHWHVLCGHNEEECGKSGYIWANDIFNAFVNKFNFNSKYNVEDYERISHKDLPLPSAEEIKKVVQPYTKKSN